MEDLARRSLRPALIIVGLGILFDVSVNGQLPGLSVPLFTAVVAITFRLDLPRSRYRDFCLIAAVVVTAFVPFRASESLDTLNVAIAAGLLGVAATGGSIFRESLASALDRGLIIARSSFRVPGMVLGPLTRGLPRASGRGRIILRAVTIAVPVAVVFAALLGSADPVFARTILPNFPSLHVDGIASHLFLTLAGIAMTGTLWVASAQPLPDREQPDRSRLSVGEWAPALGVMVALFALFAVVQIAVLFAGRHRVEVTPGLTYAQYARSGFFQLLAAGVLTYVVVVLVWDFGKRESAGQRRLFAVAVSSIVALCLMILVSAAVRLSLYQAEFGFTVTRLAAWFAIGFTGAALLVLAATVWMRRRRALVGGIAIVLLAATIGFNLINPDAFVATRNIDRFHATGKIDTVYLGLGLGPDAMPHTVRLLSSLDPAQRASMEQLLCDSVSLTVTPGWRSWNRSRARAEAALGTLTC